MELIVRESFASYGVFEEEVVGVLENMIQMPYRNCVAAFTIYKKAAAQAEELNEFYEWCKCIGLCGSIEYPLVGRIPQIQILALENFLNGMWGLSDLPAATTVSEEEVGMAGKDGDECDGKEMGELIDFGGDGSSVGWEELLDASITMQCMASDKENRVDDTYNHELVKKAEQRTRRRMWRERLKIPMWRAGYISQGETIGTYIIIISSL
nr:putative clathrin assembly protein At2g25430 [Ipomoea batatas]GME15048.1 putative clathrin assembly protein At2g25430 [Ipomoea batatas]